LKIQQFDGKKRVFPETKKERIQEKILRENKETDEGFSSSNLHEKMRIFI